MMMDLMGFSEMRRKTLQNCTALKPQRLTEVKRIPLLPVRMEVKKVSPHRIKAKKGTLPRKILKVTVRMIHPERVTPRGRLHQLTRTTRSKSLMGPTALMMKKHQVKGVVLKYQMAGIREMT